MKWEVSLQTVPAQTRGFMGSAGSFVVEQALAILKASVGEAAEYNAKASDMPLFLDSATTVLCALQHGFYSP